MLQFFVLLSTDACFLKHFTFRGIFLRQIEAFKQFHINWEKRLKYRGENLSWAKQKKELKKKKGIISE